MDDGLLIQCDDAGQVASVRLYGQELLDTSAPCRSELHVNSQPLPLRKHVDPNDPRGLTHLKGERFVDHFSGWGLVVARSMGERPGMKHRCFGVQTVIRRELADATLPCPGPGGPVVEAPLHVDTFGLLNWNWRFWGDDTRMIFPSSHSGGPADEFGHVGYEHDTPEACKRYLQNVWRRIYPGCMVIHGGLFYNARTGHWLAITCRRPGVGYILNINDAGRGVGYDFTLHAPFKLGDSLHMPEIKLYFGQSRDEMMSWLGDYVTHYYQTPPKWVFQTLWGEGLSWNNQPTWTQQADYWERKLDSGELTGIGYCLVTNRPVRSGTTPLGYEPDPNHGTIEEFQAMCRRLADRGVPMLVWMSHAGLSPQGGPDIDDDWFIRGIDGRTCAAWGNIDSPELVHVNPAHPGYIEYTKKWIRFYIKQCRCKGVFFDCLSWAFPPDFRPRSFMRYPGDTNLGAIRFMQEVYDCIHECDGEAVMLGEGASLDGPINVLSIHSNPVRAIDGLGPRDFFLQLNRYAPKRMVIDQGPNLFPAAGFIHKAPSDAYAAHNRYLATKLRNDGGAAEWTALPGDLSLQGDLLVVPVANGQPVQPVDVRLPAPHEQAATLVEEITAAVIRRDDQGLFRNVPPGIYRVR